MLRTETREFCFCDLGQPLHRQPPRCLPSRPHPCQLKWRPWLGASNSIQVFLLLSSKQYLRARSILDLQGVVAASEARLKLETAASEARLKMETAASEARLKMETKSGREDARALAVSSSRSLIITILYSKLGFGTKQRQNTGKNTFVSTLQGGASWDGKVVAGAKEEIEVLATLYQNLLKEESGTLPCPSKIIPGLENICHIWDDIKDNRINEQHYPNLTAALAVKIAFYARHVTLGDVLGKEDQEMYDTFRIMEQSDALHSAAAAGGNAGKF
jgi:hypothetical protein